MFPDGQNAPRKTMLWEGESSGESGNVRLSGHVRPSAGATISRHLLTKRIFRSTWMRACAATQIRCNGFERKKVLSQIHHTANLSSLKAIDRSRVEIEGRLEKNKIALKAV